MARRKQLKGLAGNLVQYCMSRSFDCEGYWAIGKFYAYAEATGTKEFAVKLVDEYVPIDAIGIKYSTSIKQLSNVLQRYLESNGIPGEWVQCVSVIFKFDTDYQDKYHPWRTALRDGEPFICTVEITSDLGSTYSKELGCNVWVHDPKREYRRLGLRLV